MQKGENSLKLNQKPSRNISANNTKTRIEIQGVQNKGVKTECGKIQHNYSFEEHLKFIEHNKKMIKARSEKRISHNAPSNEAKVGMVENISVENSPEDLQKSAVAGKATSSVPILPSIPIDLTALSPRLGDKSDRNIIEASV